MAWRRGTPPTGGEPPDDGSGGGIAATADPDLALVRRAQRDPAAFDELFARFWRPLLGFCRLRLGDHDEGEEVAQVVMIEVHRKLGTFKPKDGATFRSWLYTIAYRRTTDAHRQDLRRSALPFPEVVRATGFGSDPEAEAIRAAALAELHAVISALPPDYRAVLELRAAELTTAEIAHVLETSAANVRQREHRAIERLKKGGRP